MSDQAIDTGDTVEHLPTGECWVVAYVDGQHLAWCGWPAGEAALSDCVLRRRATDEERWELLLMLANSADGPRSRYARTRLEAEATS